MHMKYKPFSPGGCSILMPSVTTDIGFTKYWHSHNYLHIKEHCSNWRTDWSFSHRTAILCIQADSLCSSCIWLRKSNCSFTQHVFFKYPPSGVLTALLGRYKAHAMQNYCHLRSGTHSLCKTIVLCTPPPKSDVLHPKLWVSVFLVWQLGGHCRWCICDIPGKLSSKA